MALFEFNNIGITGIAACVPKNRINNYNQTQYFDKVIVNKIVDKIGITERRFADKDICSSDLCFTAAEKLIKEMDIDKSEIDLLILVSQTPDYRSPATSIILQHRLGLGTQTAAFDINLACSGFVYGLSAIYSFMQTGGFRKALLVNGETNSKKYSAKDRKTAFLFGDGGAASIIEQNEKFGKSYFSLKSDGSKENLIKITGGGYRVPSSVETLREKVVDEYGNLRTEEQGSLSGADVFNFVLSEIPKDIKTIIKFSKIDLKDIDYYLFHQANGYMNNCLVKKMKLKKEQIPTSLEKFGNTSHVSIPINIVSELKDNFIGNRKLLLSGFGSGMSWASCILNVVDCHVSELIEL